VLRVNARLNLLYPLAPLFASLLSGCFASSSCDDFKGGTYTRTIELTAIVDVARGDGDAAGQHDEDPGSGRSTQARDDDAGGRGLQPSTTS
jgi:hypothetical protein